ncbi:hypothetical protein K461DRAFT_273610 [Myriangium duriaei CBS 260.36]|uniref:Uncharacterized protein n=1 Tax=Myriangium duriaei CBS 260.36 TaxID=1168546 RepID=A0A9P4J9P7_9PEZI|nr:hypothetical protein K461DRAFT_273610 [Myriangium duriaei CBS 260.36]
MTTATPHEPPLSKISTSTQSTWKSTSSSSSASRYALDTDDHAPILVYRWDGGIEKTSQQELATSLDRDHQRCRVTKKPIPRGASIVEVKRHDLYMPNEMELYKEFPNYNSSLASIKLPSNIYWNRYLFGSYDKLYIISPETTPAITPTDNVSYKSDSDAER